MAIIDETIYGLKGKQITQIVNAIRENASDIVGLGTTVAGKQDTLSATQLTAVNSGIDSTKVAQIATNATDIDGVEAKIPAQATSSNQLADKAFVNSSIATNTANFIGTFNSVAELEAYSGPVTNNDYAFVIVTDAQGNTAYDRYKYSDSTSTWLFEYELNNSSFTAAQWASINSGITSGDVTKLGGIAAGAEVNVQSNWNESDTSSDAYIQNKPANLVQDANYVHTDNNFTTALKDKLDGIASGAEVNAIDSVSVNGTAVTPDANKNVDLTIPEEIKVLTTADYNWSSSGNPPYIAINFATMESGIYRTGENVLILRGSFSKTVVAGSTIIVVNESSNMKVAYVFSTSSSDAQAYAWYSDSYSYNLIPHQAISVINNLTSSSTTNPLSANMGRELNTRIGDLSTLTTTAKTSAVAAINELDSEMPVITMSSTDPGEGAALAANHFIAYCE